MMLFGTSNDLWSALGFIALGLGFLAIVAAIVVWRARRRESTTLIMDVALTLSTWWVLLSLLGLGITVTTTLTGAAGFTANTSFGLPWPATVPCDALDEGSGPRLLCGSGSLTSPWVMGSSLGVRVLVALSMVCTAVLIMIPAALIGVISFLTLRGHPFTETVTRALTAGALGVLIIGIAAGMLPEISGVLALREALPIDSEFYPTSFQLGISLPAIGGALALAALAAVFREGSRLQQEREHLERETARLQKDTEGLV